jgi:CheY-like chemotaxis protein
MDGFAFRTEQMKRKNMAHLPVIALTGNQGLRQHALRVGFTAALQKPCDASMLLSLVAHHCDRGGTTRPR